jgi:HEAT repeat protein
MNRAAGLRWAVWILIIGGIIGWTIWRNVQTQKTVDDLVSKDAARQVAAAKVLATHDSLYDLVQQRPIAARMRAADAFERLGTEEAVKALLALQKDPEIRMREHVTQKLITLAPKYPQPLLDALKDADSNVRAGAAKALATLGEPIVPKLVEALKDGGSRAAASDALSRIGKVCTPQVLPLIDEEDEALRIAVAELLGKLGDPRAVPALLRHQDDSPAVRRTVIGALAAIAHSSAEDALLRALNNPEDDGDARAQAAVALGKIASARGVATLVRALSDEDLIVRSAAVGALARAGRAAIPALTQAIRNADPEVRRLAAEALGGMNDPAAVAPLSVALKDPDYRVRRTAATSLGQTGQTSAIPHLLDALSDPDGGVGEAAANSLANLGAAAVQPLIARLGGNNPTVAYLAARALSAMGDVSITALQGALNSPNATARHWALIALAGNSSPRAAELLQQVQQRIPESERWIIDEAVMRLGSSES